MKKLLLSATLLFSLATYLKAQTPSLQWAKPFGGTSNEYGYGIATDASGNVYTTGYFSSTTDFDPGVGVYTLTPTGGSGEDVFITKFDASGNFVWAKQLGGASQDNGNAIAVDATGNVYTTGFFQGTSDFDPGVGTFTLASAGSYDIFVSKLNSAGNFVWARAMGGTSGNFGYSIAVDATGNVYTTGSFQGTSDFDPGVGTVNLTSAGSVDIFVSKLDASGNFVWAKQMGGTSGDIGKSIAVDATGNVYITGLFQATGDFDPGVGTLNFTSAGGEDIFVSKLNSLGALVWGKQIGGTGYDNGNSIAVDASGNVYTTGFFNATVDFDPGVGSFSLTSAGSSDIFVSKLDASGSFLMAKQLGGTSGDAGKSIALDASGNIYTTGSFQGTSDFDPGAGTYTLSSAGFADIFVSKLTNAGVFVWAVQLGVGQGNSIALDASANVLTTGSFQGAGDFDPGVGVSNLISVGGPDVFVHKMSQGCAAPAAPTNTTSPANQTICNGLTTMLNATSSGTVNWYATPTSTTALGSGTVFTTSTLTAGTYTFYAEAATCTISASRTAITVTVNALPTITVNSGTICSGSSFTLTPGGANTYTFSGGSAIVSPTVNTTYTVTGTSMLSCTNTVISSVSVVVCTGIHQLTNSVSELSIYPNPFTNKVTVSNGATKQIVQVINTLGSLIYNSISEAEKLDIDLSQQPSGIYFIKIGSVTKKIIKE